MINEELQQQIERLEQQIKDLKVKLEEKVEKKPYEVEVPEDIENYYYVDADGLIESLLSYSDEVQKSIFNRGLAFKTKEEAKQFDKERILINKFKNWVKEHNESWTPNWKNDDEEIYEVQFNRFPRYIDEDVLVINEVDEVISISKLPYFKSYKIALEFIKEFGDEIKEVLC